MQSSRLGITASMLITSASGAMAAAAISHELRTPTNYGGRLSEVHLHKPARNPLKARRPEGMSARQEKKQAKATRRKHREAMEEGVAG